MTNIQGLGWFLRRTTDPIALGDFYEKALGLPRLRSWRTDEYAGVMLWAGDVCVFETNLLNGAPISTPSESQCIPVFRCYDLQESRDRLVASGARPTGSESNERAETHFFEDIDGYPIAIEFVTDDSFTEIDRSATRAWREGQATLSGGIKIDGAIQKLSRVIHATTDPKVEADFLIAGLGLEDLGMTVGNRMLNLGETAVLEIRSSTFTCSLPASRESVGDTWILREYDHEALTKAMLSIGQEPIEVMQFKGGDLSYFITPTQRLFGFQERRRYDPDESATQMVEDLVARSRWLARHKPRSEHVAWLSLL